jgi:3-deoxy-D-manno-octulosonic-acid transferase
MQALQFAPVAIQHQMIPYDYPFAVARFLEQIQPKLVMMVETEIWPNLYQACSQRGIPIVLINARLKAQSFHAYQKWGGQMLRTALNQTHWIGAQFTVDADYFRALGAQPDKVKTLGNLKFDLSVADDLTQKAQQWRHQLHAPNRFIWVAASTHKSTDTQFIDEELMMLQAHQQLLTHQPDALLILVPRHADRFNDVAQMLAQSKFNWTQRSTHQTTHQTAHQSLNATTQVYLADTIGELMLWFAVANVAFVGGSLVPFGGHNILEPAALKKPVLSGPHYANLQALFAGLIQQQAVQIVPTVNHLANTLITLAADPAQCERLGQQAYQAFSQQSGVLDKIMHNLQPLLPKT